MLHHGLFVLHHHVVVLVEVYLALLASDARLLLRPARLYADVLVQLGLQHLKLVEFGLVGHAQAPVAVGPPIESRPEIGKLVDDLGIVADGASQVAGLVEQQGAVVDGHDVLRLHPDDIVEIGDGTVVVAHLHAQQSTVVMGKEVVGVEVEGHVVVAHGSPQVVAVEPHKGAVDIATHHLGLEVDDLTQLLVGLLPFLLRHATQLLVGLLPFLLRHANIGPGEPRLPVVGIPLQCLIQPFGCGDGVVLHEADARFHGIGPGVLTPFLDDGVEFELCTVVVLEFYAAQCPVEPEVLRQWFFPQCTVVVGDGFLVFLLTDAAQSPQFVDAHHVGIEFDGLGAVALGTGEVVEIILGDTSIKPRFVKIRLRRDGAVEMLDGEHIVLIIQGTSTAHDESVDIELRRHRERQKRQRQEYGPLQHTHTPLFSSHGLVLVGAVDSTLQQCLEAAADHGFAERRHTVDEHFPVEVVELMLHDACEITVHPLFVGVALGILVTHTDARGSCHLLVNAGQAEASFLRNIGVAVVILLDVGIDECLAEAHVFWHVLRQHIEVDDHHADILSDLRCGQTDAVRLVEGLEHIDQQLVEVGEIGGDVLRHLPQHRLPIYINR